ncbi:MAG: dienelactone hydrolase family protein [Candidatus Binatia bacterium]
MSDQAELTFQRDGDTIRGYAARPSGAGPFPALVLIPDVHGLAEHYRDLARRFAAEGFFTFAIDLYSRAGAPTLPDPKSIMDWLQAMPDRRVLADLDGAVQHLAALPEVRPDAIGITGFCVGGQYALMAACTTPRLAACVSWYGMLRYAEKPAHRPDSPLDLAPHLHCPYLGLFGAEDGLIPPADVAELRAILEREHKEFEIHTYPGAGHAFFNDSRPASYHPAAAAAAWPRALAFLRAHL